MSLKEFAQKYGTHGFSLMVETHAQTNNSEIWKEIQNALRLLEKTLEQSAYEESYDGMIREMEIARKHGEI